MREVWSMIGEAWLGMLTWFALCVCVNVVVYAYEQLATTLQRMYVCVHGRTPVYILCHLHAAILARTTNGMSLFIHADLDAHGRMQVCMCISIHKYIYIYMYIFFKMVNICL